jgi:UDP-3-O-[3-hydroxymyristoyl] N-acetylglucosamine deacetylase/3-hydroxyacyl-[acyl-carrier-protein] dehydratase
LSRKQLTIAEAVTLKGVGLHSGEDVSLVMKSAGADTGVTFVRTDLPESPGVLAEVRNVVDRERRTVLKSGEAEVQTTEHLLACLLVLGIDNLKVEVDGPELPGLDGSALPYFTALRDAGSTELDAPRRHYRPAEEVVLDRAGEDVTIVAAPAGDGLTVSYTLDYKTPELPVSRVAFPITPETFEKEIAPARTFCLESEAEALRAAGLGRGADTTNTLVVGEDGEPLENQVRFPDEYARHKMLDLLGDLFLLNADLGARITAVRSGHAANVELVRRLKKAMARDLGGTSQHLDIREVMRILPHRYPFLLIDRVVELEGYRRAVGIKNVSINEPFFQGHWPDQPVMPGVLIVEAMAQLSGVLLLRKLEHTGKLAVLLSIDRVKLRRAVVPGDQLRIESVAENVKPRTGRVLCTATVQGKLAAQARIKFMLVDADG